MMRMRFLIALTLAFPAAARAKGPAVEAEGQTVTQACAGQPAMVAGNRNTVTFTGDCKSLTIRGDGNKITASLGEAAEIDVQGNGNQVGYHASSAPKLHISGSSTEILPSGSSPAPIADAAQISGDNQRLELDCAGRPATLQGNRWRVRLRNACQALTIRGDGNAVQAELAPGAAVLVEGNGTTVTYTLHGAGPDPVATLRGLNSQLEADASAAQRPAPALPPASGASVPVLMNDLHGIVVEAGTLVHVPPALLQGASLTPAGQAFLDRLTALIGQINPTGLRITARDPSDTALAAQRLAAVQGWLEQHRSKALPIQTATEAGNAMVDVLILR